MHWFEDMFFIVLGAVLLKLGLMVGLNETRRSCTYRDCNYA